MKKRYMRRRKLIKPQLQMRLIFVFLSVAMASVIIQAIVMNHTFLGLLRESETDQAALLSQWSRMLWTNVGLVMSLLIPIALVVGTIATFKIAGPLYRFEQHCKSIIRGEDPGVCRLRQGDELQDLCELLNQTFDTLRRGAPSTSQATEATEEEERQAA